MRACPLYLLILLAFSSCSLGTHGFLSQITSGPVDPTQIHRYCDLEDETACFLRGEGRPENLPRVPIVQGIAPEGKAVFAALLNSADIRWLVYEKEKNSLTPVPVSAVYTHEHSQWLIQHILVKDLTPGKTYQLLLTNAAGKLLDLRTFKTFSPTALDAVAFVSGTDPAEFAKGAALWQNLAGRKPSLLFALGDTSGPPADTNPDPAAQAVALWHALAAARGTITFFRSSDLLPIIAIWNRQDYGRGVPPDRARRTFEAFFPFTADAKTLVDGPGLAKALRAGDQTWVLFDNQSFRSGDRHCKKTNNCPKTPPGEAGEEESHFGNVQESWAAELVRGTKGAVWLLSGDPWFSQTADSFAGDHPENFRHFLESLRKSTLRSRGEAAPALAFVSGAAAQTAVRRVKPYPTYNTHELTIAPMHSPNAGPGSPSFAFMHLRGNHGVEIEAVGESQKPGRREIIKLAPAAPSKSRPKRRP